MTGQQCGPQTPCEGNAWNVAVDFTVGVTASIYHIGFHNVCVMCMDGVLP